MIRHLRESEDPVTPVPIFERRRLLDSRIRENDAEMDTAAQTWSTDRQVRLYYSVLKFPKDYSEPFS